MSGADFLSGEQTDPLSGEALEFVSTGFIGQVKATRLHELSSVYDPSEAGLPVKPVVSEKRGEYFWMWFDTKDNALLAQETLESEYGSREVWRFTMRSDTITNIPAATLQDKFRDYVTGSSRTSMHQRYRHQLHMIALPAAVAAFACMLGYTVPDVNFDELASNETEYTDQLMYTLIGDPSEKDLNSPNHYFNSQLWKQRASIWAALGESDPFVYNATYDKTPEANPTLETPNTTFTKSEKLARALGVAHKIWTNATYARVLFVVDPHVDANHDFDKVPAIMEFYPDKSAAVKAGAIELAKRKDSAESDSGPAIPADWADDPDQWVKEVDEIRASLDGAKSPKVKRLGIEKYITENYEDIDSFGATVDDVLAHL